MSEAQIAEAITKINNVMMTMFELPEDKIKPEAQLFTDLGLDSLDAIDLMMKVQDDFGVRLSNEELMSLRTLDDIHNLARKFVVEQATKH
ncbi:MAG: acyl carrier protein [Pseudomonadota bacterium]